MDLCWAPSWTASSFTITLLFNKSVTVHLLIPPGTSAGDKTVGNVDAFPDLMEHVVRWQRAGKRLSHKAPFACPMNTPSDLLQGLLGAKGTGLSP